MKSITYTKHPWLAAIQLLRGRSSTWFVEQGRRIHLETLKGKDETFLSGYSQLYGKQCWTVGGMWWNPHVSSGFNMKCALIFFKWKIFRMFVLTVYVRYPIPTGFYWLCLVLSLAEVEAESLCCESHRVPPAWLGWWNKGYSHYIAQNIQRQSVSMVENRIITQNDCNYLNMREK